MVARDRRTGLVEGDYVETVEGLLFTVKGLHHPEGLVIAYLRYVPDPNGDRSWGSHRYRRVYDIDESNEFLRKWYPQYVNYVKAKGLALQSVPFRLVSRVYSPRERLKAIIGKPETVLEKTVDRFASALSSESGVPIDHIGVSGSVLINLAKPTSDVDLIVYGIDAGKRVYEALRELRESREWIRPYDSETVRSVVRSRWGDTGLDVRRLCDIEARKVLHGLVEGRDFFIRLVRAPEEFERAISSRPLGKAALRVDVIDAEESIFTPCTYHVENCSYLAPSHGPQVAELVSYRGKFTEQVGEGEKVEVRGTVEEVVHSDRTVYRMMLGGRGDYLVPLSVLNR